MYGKDSRKTFSCEGRVLLPLRLKWLYSDLAAAGSFPVISSGIIYTGGNPRGDAEEWVEPKYLVALDSKDGRLIWKAKLEGILSPAIWNEKLFVISKSALCRIDAQTGELEWQYKMGEHTAGSVLIADDIVLCTEMMYTRHHRIFVCSAQTGSLLWTREFNVITDPIIEQGNIYLANCLLGSPPESAELLCLSLQTGETKWIRRIGGRPDTITCSNSRIYLLGGSGDSSRVLLQAFDVGTGENPSEFEVNIGEKYALPGIVAFGDYLILRMTMDSGFYIYCFDIKSWQLRWKKQLSTGKAFSQPIVCWQYLIAAVPVAGTSERKASGKLVIMDVNSGDILAEHDIGFVLMGSPVIGEDTLCVSTERGVHAFYVSATKSDKQGNGK